ncbi:DUF309 domain-containing protein [Actinocorallia sp. A-T 12471]|uniref:DUF309 domain-containing protein n=1 Tax=Actinocorallia sp. A-T 12471 TaxID=3089813 RepID=UPI0029CEF9BB|nr:DUF309 domain-containing protein [Actinocorallia sp. A-T 12471]MDX6742568.1 DUF309 domain-containing protein [Actinocorallia sp. A-T 12471]
MRDRDTGGRPRNARPRDAYGRPLPYGAEGVPTTPDDLTLDAQGTVTEARRLLAADRPFHAHEVLEARWKSCPDAERPLWRALAQLAVGLTHLRRGNTRGADALFTRALRDLRAYDGPSCGLDLPAVVRAAEDEREVRL